MYLRPHLARSSDRTSFTHRVSPGPPLPRRVPHRSHLSLSRAFAARSSRSHPNVPARSRFRALALPFPLRRATAFFSPAPPFFLSTPPGPSSDFYNLLLVARYTPSAAVAATAAAGVSGAAHPEKPENRGKQKRPARCAAPCIPRDALGRQRRRWRGTASAAVGAEKKKKAPRDQRPTRRIIRANACARLFRARALTEVAAENDFSAAVRCAVPAGNSHRICGISNARSFRSTDGRISIDIFPDVAGIPTSVKFPAGARSRTL